MTDIPDVITKRLFDKLDAIELTLHEQCKRISNVESTNKIIASIWKKLLTALAISSSIIAILVVIT